jgi:OOP family OmpA-OmpF porin
MRTVVMVSAGALALVASPAAAEDGAWYVGGDFGAMIVEDTSLDYPLANTDDAVALDHDYGFDGALFVGYDLGAFRLESEVSYRQADLDAFENIIAIPSTSGPHPVGLRDGFGSTSALAFMINGMLDFGDDDGLSGFVGGGVGMARVNYSNLRAFEDTGTFLDDSDSGFAWQVVAGLRQAISDNVDVHVRYRFFNAGDISLSGFGGEEVEGRFRSHSLLGGLTFNFGGPQ